MLFLLYSRKDFERMSNHRYDYMKELYKGTKEMLLVDDIDNTEFLREPLVAMYDGLPAPKSKK